MEPSNVRLVNEVAAVLKDRIAPAVSDDPWVASELRSICSVLGLVAARMEHEDAFLAADNSALQRLLGRLSAAGVTGPAAEVPGARPSERNVQLRSALEDLLPELHDGHHAEQVAAVRSYLREAAGREREIYAPLSAVAMF